MEPFQCKVSLTTTDRRNRLLTKKTLNPAFLTVRYIQSDRSFHLKLGLRAGSYPQAFISARLQVSDNVSTMGSIGINIPEFRTTLVIEELELSVTECVSDRVLVLPRIMSIFNLEEIEAAEVDKENDSNGVNVSATVQNNGTPEKIKHTSCSNDTSEKKKFRSPLKSGCTPNKKKDRSAGGLRERDSPPQMSQIFSFMTAPSHRNSNSSSASGSTNQGNSRNGFGRESISPGDVNLTETQLAVLERCKQGENVFLTGGAGTGKSHLLKCILQEMVILHGKQAVSVTATTGIAAVSVGGTTVHQFAGIRPGDTVTEVGDSFKQAFKNQSVIRRWRQTQVLIVDEISMMSPQTLELVNSVAQDARGTAAPMGGVQVIFTGDFFQLPPVSKSYDATIMQAMRTQHGSSSVTNCTQGSSREHRFCFQSPIWEDLFCSRNSFVLKEVHRQKDEYFSKLLNAIRWGDCSDFVCNAFQSCIGRELDSSDGILPTKIFTHRRDVDNLNNMELKKLSGGNTNYRAIDDGEKTYVQMLQNHCPARQNITLKIGAQVVLLKSIAPQDGLVNGSRGVVVDFTKTSKRPIVKFVGGVRRPINNESFLISLGGRVVAQRFQIPLDLAWGISVHKSQGISVDKAVLFIKNSFEYGQAYVALSRVKTIDGLSLSHSLKNCFIKAHPDVKKFYENLKNCRTKDLISE